MTDEAGNRLYCACLTFGEAVEKSSLEPKSGEDADEDEDVDDFHAAAAVINSHNSLLRTTSQHAGVSLPGYNHETIMFAPKCIALVSRHNYPEVLRNVLCVIYTVYS